MDQDQKLVTANNTAYCCVNNATDTFMRCGTEQNPASNTVCCPTNLCKHLYQDNINYTLCCPNQEDKVCQINVNNYTCCPRTRCISFEEISQDPGLCCPVGTTACPNTLNGTRIKECCNDLFSVCLEGTPDPDRPNSLCCPRNRYVRFLNYSTNPPTIGAYTCCSSNSLTFYNNQQFCCPPGCTRAVVGQGCTC